MANSVNIYLVKLVDSFFYISTDFVTIVSLHQSILPRWLSGKESACNARDACSISELGRSPGGGKGNPLQYSCLENSMDSGAWLDAVHGVTKNWTELRD